MQVSIFQCDSLCLPFCCKIFHRGLFSSTLKGKAFSAKELELAVLLRFQPAPQVSLPVCTDEKPDLYQRVSQGSREEDIVEKKPPLTLVEEKKNVKSEGQVVPKPIQNDGEQVEDQGIANVLSDSSYPCEICGITFITRAKVKTHMKSHTKNREAPDKLPCTICPKVFCNKYYLKHHIKSHTEKNEKEKEKAICSVCSKLLIRDFMGEHMRNIHGENKHVPCNNCGLNYRLSSIKRHQKFCKRTEEERKARKAAIAQKCDRCGKFLCNIFKLRKHMKICVQ